MQIAPPGRRAVWAGLALLSLSSSAAAVTSKLAIRQFLHDAWTDAAGSAIGNVNALVQARDGYLWLATSNGLARFDGIHYSMAPGESAEGGAAVAFLAAGRDGSVWAQHKGNVARFHQGEVDLYSVGTVWRVAEGRGGEIWLLQPDGVSLLPAAGRSPRRFTTADGLPAAQVIAMAPAAGGGLWLGTDGAVCRWIPGAAAQCRDVPGKVRAVAEGGPDEVYAASGLSVVRMAGGRVETLTTELGAVTIMTGAIFADRGGSVWIGTTGGLLRIRRGAAEWFTRKDGLSADAVTAIAEDAEGDLWVGTNHGFDRFRDPVAIHLSTLDGLSGDFVTAVEATPDGDVWVGTIGNGLNRWHRGLITAYSPAQGLAGKSVVSLHMDRRGVLWVGGDRGVARLEQGRLCPAWPSSGGAKETFSISEDLGGAAWLADQSSGVWRVEGERAARISGLPFPDIFRVAGAPDGSVWLGSFRHGVAKLRGGVATTIEASIGPGAPRALMADDAGAVWIGAGRVLSRVRNGKATVWGPQQGMPAGDIMGMADDSRGSLWIVTSSSLLRIARAELDRCADGAPQSLRFARYDARDGLRLRPSPGMSSPRIAAAADGRIWVPEQDGIAVIDPELLQPDTVPPPVHAERITVDGGVLPRGPHRFRGHETRIAYAGLSLKAPERVRFRYRIEPGGPAWTDAGHQREVTFVNLPPDHYRFRVAACNLDNVCNLEGDAIEFEVVPYFYQTIWAKLLWAALAAISAWGVFRLRLRQMQARFRLAAQERARVTREIHDTLLQGFAGVVYQLEAASRQFESQPAASKDRLERAISQADDALTEARKMLQDMRLPVLEDRTLPEALEEAGRQAAESVAASFTVRTKGRVTPLPYAAQAAMFLIGREAIRNAVNHAGAGRITVHLVYGDREFRMMIHDDGSGFDPDAARQKAGHFGVASMGERARQAGADLRIESAPGRGTTVAVTIGRKQ